MGSDRPAKLVRPRLIRRLREAVEHPVTVITAPAGYGKSVLVDQWASEHDGPPMARLTLRPDDDWPRAAARLDEVLPSPGEAILVIDGVDRSSDEGLARELATLVERSPADLHLVLVSRSRAVPVLDRLHERRDVAFLTAADLTFTAAEVKALVRAVAGLTLDEPAVESLVERTEGWPVGLEVAAVDLRGADDHRMVIDALPGDERHIGAYLFDEVFAPQPPVIRRFLAETSVLDRLNGSLCDDLTGRDDGAVMLRRLERSGVLMRRVRGAREWYVCHRLFRQFLRRQLRSGPSVAEPTLLTRAGAWHAAHDDPDTAARYFAEARAWDALVEMADVYGGKMYQAGRTADVVRWLDAVPRTTDTRGKVAVRRAFLHTMLGETHQAAQLLHDVEIRGYSAGDQIAAKALRAMWTFFDASPEQTIRIADEALYAMGGIDPAELPNVFGMTSPTSLVMMAATSRAKALWYLGDIPAARRALLAGTEQEDAYEPLRLRTLGTLAVLEAWAGNLRVARAHALRACKVAQQAGMMGHPAMLDCHLALAHVSRERGHHHRAAQLLEQADAVLADGRRPNMAAITAVERGLCYLAAGHPKEGLAHLEEHRAGGGVPPPPIVEANLRATQARLLQALGEVERAESIADDSSMRLLCPELPAAWVQAAVSRGDVTTAADRLDRWAVDGTEPRNGLQHRLWVAVVEFEAGDRRRALNAVAAVAAMAERQGDIRLFLDGGRPVERLLTALLHTAPDRFVERVLRTAQLSSSPTADPRGLSRRELEVARYLPTPLSSAEIAERLYISLNTLKTHLRTIYSKLGATNRREAIQRAEELGIA